jgi:glycosyltransferase involved in cell wall biosynthesis
MQAPKPRLFIIDQNLNGYNGHYWEYDSAVARIFSAREHAVIILANKAAQGALPAGIEVHPWFTFTSADISRPEIYRQFRRNFGRLPLGLLQPLRMLWRQFKKDGPAGEANIPAFGKECREAIARFKVRPEDAFFIQTVHGGELRALARALTGIAPCPRLLIMLRREPEDPAMAGLDAVLQEFDALRGRLFFFADTPTLAEAYRRQYGIAVSEVPVICDLALIRELSAKRAKTSTRKIMYLGNARAEKGFHLLPELVEALASQPGIEFHFQAHTTPDDDPDERIEAAIERLKRLPRVTLYPQPLSQRQYIELLCDADIVLLPYDTALYQRRSSGILTQALAAGKVAVAPEGIWFSDAVPPDLLQRFAPGGLTQAVRTAITSFETISAALAKYRAHLNEKEIDARFYAALENSGASPSR